MQSQVKFNSTASTTVADYWRNPTCGVTRFSIFCKETSNKIILTCDLCLHHLTFQEAVFLFHLTSDAAQGLQEGGAGQNPFILQRRPLDQPQWTRACQAMWPKTFTGAINGAPVWQGVAALQTASQHMSMVLSSRTARILSLF